MKVTGGPLLGWFKVEKAVNVIPEVGPNDTQWIITEHRNETCN